MPEGTVESQPPAEEADQPEFTRRAGLGIGANALQDTDDWEPARPSSKAPWVAAVLIVGAIAVAAAAYFQIWVPAQEEKLRQEAERARLDQYAAVARRRGRRGAGARAQGQGGAGGRDGRPGRRGHRDQRRRDRGRRHRRSPPAEPPQGLLRTSARVRRPGCPGQPRPRRGPRRATARVPRGAASTTGCPRGTGNGNTPRPGSRSMRTPAPSGSSPARPEAYVAQAGAASCWGIPASAITAFRRALEINSRYSVAEFWLGEALPPRGSEVGGRRRVRALPGGCTRGRGGGPGPRGLERASVAGQKGRTMLDKPSKVEDEYFAREDVEKKRKLAFQQAQVMAEQQKDALRTLHYMKCPKCGFDLHTLKRGEVDLDTCFNCKGLSNRRRGTGALPEAAGVPRAAARGRRRAPEHLQERLTMSLTLEEVRHVASLARLSLSAEEEALMRTQLSAILDAVAELARVDTSAVEPTSHAAGRGRALAGGRGAPILPAGEGARQRAGEGRAPASPSRRSSSSAMEPTELSMLALGKKLGSGELSSVEAVRACLARVDRFDGKVKAFLRVDREGALAQAEAADRRRKDGERAGPLDGVPIALKDLFLTEGLPHHRGLEDPRGLRRRPTTPPWSKRLRRPDAVHRRQDEPGRVRDGLVDREQRVRPDAQPVGPRAHAGRLVGRQRGGGRGADGVVRARHRHRRLDPPARGAHAASSASSRPTAASRATG